MKKVLPKKSKDMVFLTIRLDPNLKKRFKEYCVKYEISAQEVVTNFIKSQVEGYINDKD